MILTDHSPFRTMEVAAIATGELIEISDGDPRDLAGSTAVVAVVAEYAGRTAVSKRLDRELSRAGRA